MRKPYLRIDSSIHSQKYENQSHLEFGPELPKTPPLENPEAYISNMATALSEVIWGLRPVDQLASVLNEQVYETLRQRSLTRAQARLGQSSRRVIQPTGVLKVIHDSPTENVIESVVLLSNRQRSRALAIRLEGQHGSWRATNIGYL
jgi:hypothetical protein